MRKTWKRVLSYVLSATMVLTAGAFSAGKTAEATEGVMNGSFNVEIIANNSIWDWQDAPSGSVNKLEITDFGEYTLTTTASQNANGLESGALYIATDFEAMPTECRIVPQTIKVGTTKYDWSAASLCELDGDYRIPVWNAWDNKETAELSNPMKDLTIESGTKITFTFTVEDTKLDSVLFRAYFMSNGGCWDYLEAAPATPDNWSLYVNEYKDYTLQTVATKSGDFLTGATWIETTLTTLPTAYQVVPKSVVIGSKTYDWSKAALYQDIGGGGDIRIGLWNQWGTELGNPLGDTGTFQSGDLIKITFSVQKPSTATPVPTVNGTAKGKTFTSGSLKYKVTTAATISGTKKTTGKVTVVGLAKKKATSINVKNTVTKGTASYKVTAISAKAFQKAAKLKKATLGTAITTIPASAFNSCTKLTTVKATGVKKIAASAFKGCKVLKSLTTAKLSSVKKGAFKSCKKTIKVGGKKAVKKANVKKLKASGYKKFK